ncbi:MAG: hypothetical protein ACLS9K_03750 [Lachnospira eligens]
MMIMRQQLKSLFSTIISNYTSVLSEVSKNVITDMSYDFIADLAQTQLNDMATWNITQISVTELKFINNILIPELVVPHNGT